MRTHRESGRSPLILIANDDEWSIRSLETILEPAGHSTIRAFSATQAIDAAVRKQPDAILVDAELPDRSGLDVCRTLHEDPRVRSNTAILLTAVDAVAHAQRIEALEVGAWEVVRLPVDAHEFLLRLRTFVGAKRDADRRRADTLLDPETGLYNLRGLLHRAREIALAAQRYERPIACIAFGPASTAAGERASKRADESSPLRAELARALARAARGSDVIARVARSQFALLAYDADTAGARAIADRVLRQLDATGAGEPGADRTCDPGAVGAGYFAVRNPRRSPVAPSDLVARASFALRQCSPDRSGARIRAYAGTAGGAPSAGHNA